MPPTATRWALRHLPFYGRWYRFVMTFAGISAGMETYRIDPDHDDPTPPVGQRRSTPSGPTALLAWMRSIVGDDPDLLEKVVPDYPATGKRILQDDGTWLRMPAAAERGAGPDRHRAGRPRRRRHDGRRALSGRHHLLRHRVPPQRVPGLHGRAWAGTAVSLQDQWGDEPTAYLGITMPNFPNLFCIYGPGTNLAFGASLFYHSEFQVHYAMEAIRETLASGARVWSEVTPGRPRRLRRSLPGGDRPAGVVASRPSAQPLQEQRRQGLHAVAVAARPVLGVDPPRRPVSL